MYMNEMISVGKIENGYLIEVRVPMKKKEDKKSDVCCEHSEEKQYCVKNASECAAKIAALLPLLEEDYTNEKEFDSAFDEATK
jgi:hypothetical protein